MEKTIAAISTGIVKAGIGIVRMSGVSAISIGEKIFKSKSQTPITEDVNKKLLFGHIYDEETMVDEVLISFMYSPNTYTCEDMVEIYCHGSIISLRKILDLVLKEGADLAGPGEFTKRAFLNGRLDLSQAEAVSDLINAQTESLYENSLNQLRGSLSSEIRSLREKAQTVLAQIEVYINFSEDEDYIETEDLRPHLEELRSSIKALIDSSSQGRLIKDGLKVIIMGKPNVGKSSLLNALLKENRAIITDIPGTTRDVIEEAIEIDSIPVRLIDTAGIRDTEDEVERLGVERSISLSQDADLLVGVFDGSRALDEEDERILHLMDGKKSIALVNKSDLERKTGPEDILARAKSIKVIESSIKEGLGVEELKEEISSMFFLGDIEVGDSLIITSSRQVDLLKKALRSLEEGLEALDMGMDLEMVEVDIRSTWLYLASITGENMDTESLLDQIFGEFCIGK